MFRFLLAALAAGVPVSALADDVTRVDVLDLSVNPGKFVGRRIEVRGVQCYAADLGDYRCPTGAGLRIDFETAVPTTTISDLDKTCGTMRAPLSPRCRFNLRFKVSDWDRQLLDNMRSMIVISAGEVELQASRR